MRATEPLHPPFRNMILRRLPEESIARLKLTLLELPVRRSLEQMEEGIKHVFFIESGVGSMTTTFRDGSEVEVGLFGNESAVGVSAFMGVRRSLNRIYMQMAGRGFASRSADALAEFKRGEVFHDLALRYVQMQLTQATQSAGCNAKHQIRQRMARWLLLCMDRSGSRDLPLSQDFLATMLGAQRTTVALLVGQMTREQLISHSRGRMHLLNVAGLEAEACECYSILKDHLNNYLEFDTGFVV